MPVSVQALCHSSDFATVWERVGCLCRLLAESGSGLGEQVSLLHNGLFKISDTREKVEAMSVELKDAKKYVLDTMWQVLVQQKMDTDKQQMDRLS